MALERYQVRGDVFPQALGTIGGGNHFAELQAVDQIMDAQACAELHIDKRVLYLLVHSGSRGLGQKILERHITQFAAKGLLAWSSDGLTYLRAHDEAVRWAEANRALIARRFFQGIRSDGQRLFDHAHNTVTPQIHLGQQLWLHRKGASPGNQGPLVIPGSRGSHSYLVQPLGDQTANAFSLAHGAGRKWNRKEVKGRLMGKYKPADLRKTALGGRVICEDKALIYEEAPEAYKNIDRVIQDLVDFDLVRVLATLRPVLSYKTRRKR